MNNEHPKAIKKYSPNLDKYNTIIKQSKPGLVINKKKMINNQPDEIQMNFKPYKLKTQSDKPIGIIKSSNKIVNTSKDVKINTSANKILQKENYLIEISSDTNDSINAIDEMQDVIDSLPARSISKGINTENSSYIFKSTRDKIKEKLNRTLETDITDSIRGRSVYKKLGDIFETGAQLMTLGSTVTAFAAGYWEITLIAFIAGGLGSCSLALLKASSYSHKESKERNDQLNILLEKAKIKLFPSLVNEQN